MFLIDLCLFGGGGSKSGIGGGAKAGAGEKEQKPKVESQTFIFELDAGEGFTETHRFRAKSIEEARKKAEKYAKKEDYFGVKQGYTEEQWKNRKQSKKK